MISQQQTFLSFTHKMAAKTSWITKVRHFYPMYAGWMPFLLPNPLCQSTEDKLNKVFFVCLEKKFFLLVT